MSSLLRVLTHVRSQRWQVPAPYNHTKYTLQKDIGAAIDTSNYIKVSTLTGVSEGAPYTITSPALAAAANAYDAKADPSYFPEEILSAGNITKSGVAAAFAGNTLFSAGEPSSWTPENPITLAEEIPPQINSTRYCADQVYFSSKNSPNLPCSTFRSVDKFDSIALQAATTKGVVLIDSTLITTIPADELKGSLVISIDGNQDVISQITNALEGLSNIPVLRIISHGDDGVLRFGNQQFDSTDLISNATKIAAWGQSLTDDADILLYGCSIAKTDVGKAFAPQLASMTQADVGASSNLTGKGGDEVLEFQVGQVSNTLIAIAIDYESANLTLAQITVTTTADSGAGSLRQAITDANSTSANDEIVFASSLFTNGASWITLGSGALPTIAATTSAGSLTITGPGASSLIINGNNGNTNRNFRIFNVALGGNLSISGLTVSGAQTTDTYGEGGGIINYGTLNISNSIITGNSVSGSSSYGGGIQNDSSSILNISNTTISGNNSANHAGGVNNKGTIIITNSTISNNTAANAGGGFVNNNNGTLSIFNSTISGNTANNGSGGGIFNDTILNISNTTISNNAAVSGGGILGNGGTINIANTIIANSTTGGDYAGGATVNVTSPSTKANNLVSSGSLSWATTKTSLEINLGTLQNNGGPTSTMALGAGSVAIGAGNPTNSNASPINGLDQRGAARSATMPSIGALEFINTGPTLAAISVGGTEDNAVTFTAANFTGDTPASPGIAYVGLQADLGAGWRTASTPKTYDIDGNNVLGSNGWWLPNYTLSSPSYITSFANNFYYSGNGGYALVDNPLTTPGTTPSLIYSGTTSSQSPSYGIKSINSVVSFTLTGAVPGTIRIGIMSGNSDASGAFGASGYQIISALFDSGMTTELQTNGAVYNGNPDWAFFDITGGSAGQTYSIYANGGPLGNAGIGAISFLIRQ